MSGLTRARADELLSGSFQLQVEGVPDILRWQRYEEALSKLSGPEQLLYWLGLGLSRGCRVESLMFDAEFEIRDEDTCARKHPAADYVEAIRFCNCQCERCEEALG